MPTTQHRAAPPRVPPAVALACGDGDRDRVLAELLAAILGPAGDVLGVLP